MIIIFELVFKTSNVLIGTIFLGIIAHLMLFQNGYWNDAFWMSAILTVGVPLTIYKYLKMGKKRKSTKVPSGEF